MIHALTYVSSYFHSAGKVGKHGRTEVGELPRVYKVDSSSYRVGDERKLREGSRVTDSK